MTASAIPAATDAILALLRAALSEDQVYDGPPIVFPTVDHAVVGVSDPDDYGWQESASSTATWPHTGHYVRDERLVIHCAAIGWNGDADIATARSAAFGILAIVTAAMIADPTLSGAVLYAETVTSRVESQQTDGGAAVRVLFDVDARARIT